MENFRSRQGKNREHSGRLRSAKCHFEARLIHHARGNVFFVRGDGFLSRPLISARSQGSVLLPLRLRRRESTSRFANLR